MKVAFQHPPSAALAQGRRQRGTALLLGLLAFLVYNANGRLVSSGDCYPARYLPFGILKYGTVALDPIADTVAQGDAHPYWCVKQGGHTYSRYPIAAPVLVTPLYVPAVAYLEWQGWTEERLEQTARFMEKVTAAFIASLAVGLMYLLLVRRTTCCRPLLLTVAFGFGTNTWMISGQALWQHGLAEFLLVLALFLVLGPCTAPRALATGVCLSLIAACRPPDAILAAAVGLFGLRWARGYLGLLILGVALPLLPLLAYNYSVARNLAGGYGIGINKNPFKFSLPLGLLGLLFSPTRGLFVFSPFLLFLPLGLFGTLRQARDRALGLLVVAAVVGQAAVYAKLDWRAGCSWGPRWLTDMLPFLVWLLAAGLGHLRPFGRVLFDLAVCLSIGTQVVGAFWYTGESDTAILQGAGDPGSMTAVWDVRNTPFVAEFRHGPAPRELFLTVEGSIDRVRANEVEVERITPGTDLEIEGWALTDHRTPRTVWARLVPVDAIHWRGSRQYLTGGTDSFFERPDVTATVRGQGPAGWRVVMNTEGLRPGLYRIEVKVRGNDGGEVRPVAHRALVVAEPGEHLAPPELPVRVEGSIDRIRADGCPVARLLPGTELEIEGWALTNRRSPTAIRVRLIPTEHCGGRSSWDRSVETTSLFERPDVNLGREVSVPAGWRVVVKTVGCEPGPYRLEVLAQRDTGGEFGYCRPSWNRLPGLPGSDCGIVSMPTGTG
jgi:hypothetical protein